MDVEKDLVAFVLFRMLSWSLWKRTWASCWGELMLNSVPPAS